MDITVIEDTKDVLYFSRDLKVIFKYDKHKEVAYDNLGRSFTLQTAGDDTELVQLLRHLAELSNKNMVRRVRLCDL